MGDFTFAPDLPSPQAFKQLRGSVGWGQITTEQAAAALSSSLGGICALHEHELAGMARFVGDGVLNIYIQDVIVDETYRGAGLGKRLLLSLFEFLQDNYPANCTIGLMAAKDQDAFYAQFGFTARPSNVYGAGMIAPLGDICLK